MDDGPERPGWLHQGLQSMSVAQSWMDGTEGDRRHWKLDLKTDVDPQPRPVVLSLWSSACGPRPVVPGELRYRLVEAAQKTGSNIQCQSNQWIYRGPWVLPRHRFSSHIWNPPSVERDRRVDHPHHFFNTVWYEALISRSVWWLNTSRAEISSQREQSTSTTNTLVPFSHRIQ